MVLVCQHLSRAQQGAIDLLYRKKCERGRAIHNRYNENSNYSGQCWTKRRKLDVEVLGDVKSCGVTLVSDRCAIVHLESKKVNDAIAWLAV